MLGGVGRKMEKKSKKNSTPIIKNCIVGFSTEIKI